MAYIGMMKNKAECRKILKETGTLPKEYPDKLIQVTDVNELNIMKKAAIYRWPFFVSLVINLAAIIAYKFNIL